MKALYHHIRRFLLGLGIVALAGLSACGGGSGAAPSDSGGGAIAIEVPNVSDVTDLVYITAPVVGSVGANLSAKSTSPQKFLTDVLHGSDGSNGHFTATSVNACQTQNVTQGLLSAASHPDLGLCLMKTIIAPTATANGINIYDGNDHDAAIWISGLGLFYSRFNVNATTDPVTNKVISISQFKFRNCMSSTQMGYFEETFDGDGVTIKAVNVEGASSSTVDATGVLIGVLNDNSPQYSSKTITGSSRNTYGGGNVTETQKAILTQANDSTATVDGFQRYVTDVIRDVRIYSNFGFTYTGVVSVLWEDFDLAKYDIGAGVGRLIDSVLDHTQCWDKDGNKVAASLCNDNAIKDKTPMAVTDVSAASFVGDNEIVDCLTINPEFTIGTEGNQFKIADSACAGFKDLEHSMDCYADIYQANTDPECDAFEDLESYMECYYSKTYQTNGTKVFTVIPTIGGMILSDNSGSPTSVTTNPTLTITTNYTPDPSVFTGPAIGNVFGGQGSVILWKGQNYTSVLNNSDFETSDWTSATTDATPEAMSLTFTPTLQSNTTYILQLWESLSGIDHTAIGTTGNNNRLYYIHTQ